MGCWLTALLLPGWLAVASTGWGPRDPALTWMRGGLACNHEIARRLVLSERTVRNHVSAILVKLQVLDRAQNPRA